MRPGVVLVPLAGWTLSVLGCDALFGTHFDGRYLRTDTTGGALPEPAVGDDASEPFLADADAGTDAGDEGSALEEPDLPQALVAGGYHGCALTQQGKVKCWGSFRSSEDAQILWQASRPEEIELEPAIAVATGEAHTCAVTTAGEVRCWGRNGYGQLGDGSITTSVTPVKVRGLDSGVRTVTVGLRHSCALMLDGSVRCWGEHKVTGSTATADALTPRPVEGIADAKWISAGDFHTCAGSEKGILCWGINGGRLGTGTRTNERLPTPIVPNIAEPRLLIAGGSSTMAIDAAGTLFTWGLDPGDPLVSQLEPTVLVRGAASAAVGRHACLVTNAGTVSCWGYNEAGAIGPIVPIDEPARRPAPLPVPVNVVSVALGVFHSCALTRDAQIYCWGANDAGQLGRGATGAPNIHPQRVLWE